MKGLQTTTRANSPFSEAPRRDRSSNRVRAEALPKRQDFVLEPLESRLLLSADLLGPPPIWTDLGPGPITNAATSI